MPYSIPLDKTLRIAGWRVKIYDAEGPEEPHVSVFRRGRKWRISLRTGDFLDPQDAWDQIDKGVRAAVQAHWETLRAEWNKLHGKYNPI